MSGSLSPGIPFRETHILLDETTSHIFQFIQLLKRRLIRHFSMLSHFSRFVFCLPLSSLYPFPPALLRWAANSLLSRRNQWYQKHTSYPLCY